MVLPIVTPAPVVASHAEAFRDLFDNQCEFRHFQNYLTGLIVLENKSMANISTCILNSADKTNLSRFFREAPWREQELNDRRLRYMLEQTAPQRRTAKASRLILDDTLCEHVGSLFEYVDRHYDHCDHGYPLAHNLVTSFYLSGAVRFPVDARLYRRYEEITQWEAFVQKYFPARDIPKEKKGRQRFHREVDATLLEDPAFALLHEQFQTKISLAQELIQGAIQQDIPFQTVLMDSWYLSEDLVKTLADAQKDWVSLLKKNRNVESHSFTLRDAQGHAIKFSKPHIKIEDFVPLIPQRSYKKVTISEKDYWCFILTLRVSSLGKVRIVISYDNPKLEGTYAVLISNRTDWSAKKLIATYLQRWPIETFYQDSKGHLGLDAYRMRTSEAIKKHWCLVFVAYSLLHLACLPASPVRGKAKKACRPIKTIGEACRQQGEGVIEALILHAHDLLQRGQSAAEVFAMLFAKQRKGMATC
jgi:SRSO17 transposase